MCNSLSVYGTISITPSYSSTGVSGAASGFGALGLGTNAAAVTFNDEFAAIWFTGSGSDSGSSCSTGGWYLRTRMESPTCTPRLPSLDSSDFKHAMRVMTFGASALVGVDKHKRPPLSLDGFATRFNEHVPACSSDFGDRFLMRSMI